MRAIKKKSIFDKMVNRNYRPPPKQKPTKEDSSASDWVQLDDGTWERVDVQKPVPDPFTGVQTGVHRRSVERSMNDQKRTWKLKTDREAVKNRYGVQKVGAAVITTVLAVGSTVAGCDFRTQAVLYLTWFGVLLITDPLGAIGRFLAMPSRVLLVGCCAVLILLLCKPCTDFIIISVLIMAGSAFLIRALNDSWLSADNWRNTAAAQKAIQYDPDSLAAKNWQADGRREVRTALAEMGINSDPGSLDTLHRVAFEIGYSHGLQKTNQIRATETKLSQTQAELDNLRNEYEQMETRLQNELRTAKQDHQRAAVCWGDKRAELEKEIRRLLQTNEELIQGFDDPEPIEGSVEEKVLYARRELGYSYADCGKYAGCSKTAAYNIIKKEEENEQ